MLRLITLLCLVLIIVLAAAVITALHKPSGFFLEIPHTMKICGPDDISLVVITVHRDRMVQRNVDTPIPMSALSTLLNEIFSTRAERVLFVQGDPEISFQEFVEAIDIAKPYVDKFGWITPGLIEQDRKRSCSDRGDLVWGIPSLSRPWLTKRRLGQ